MNELTHVDLFSGIGGFALACRIVGGIRTVAFCEKDEYCQRVLAKQFGGFIQGDLPMRSPSTSPRLRSEHLSGVHGHGANTAMHVQEICSEKEEASCVVANTKCSCGISDATITTKQIQTGMRGVPIHPDIFTFDGTQYRGAWLLTVGTPCQPFSLAGKRRGKEDDRHLWPEMLRVIDEVQPTWVLGENVPGIIGMELDQVLADLDNSGYTAWPLLIPACAVDAQHRRDRVWIVANAMRWGLEYRSTQPTHCNIGEADQAREWIWPTEPDVGRVAHGIPKRVDRLRGLGNAIVPQVATEIIRFMKQVEVTV